MTHFEILLPARVFDSFQMASELRNQRGESSIFQLCYTGDFQQVKTFVENNPKSLNHTDDDGRTLLHWAVSGNHADIVNLLLEHNIKSNIKDDFGSNELMIACTIGSLNLVKQLISIGVPDVANNNKRTNLHYASSKGFLEIMDLLLENGSAVDAQDELGQTPLFRCSGRGQILAAKKLLSHGAKVNHLDGQNETCLHVAIEAGHGELAKLLIENGADLKVKNKDGKIPLEMTTDRKLVDYLVRDL